MEEEVARDAGSIERSSGWFRCPEPPRRPTSDSSSAAVRGRRTAPMPLDTHFAAIECLAEIQVRVVAAEVLRARVAVVGGQHRRAVARVAVERVPRELGADLIVAQCRNRRSFPARRSGRTAYEPPLSDRKRKRFSEIRLSSSNLPTLRFSHGLSPRLSKRRCIASKTNEPEVVRGEQHDERHVLPERAGGPQIDARQIEAVRVDRSLRLSALGVARRRIHELLGGALEVELRRHAQRDREVARCSARWVSPSRSRIW